MPTELYAPDTRPTMRANAKSRSEMGISDEVYNYAGPLARRVDRQDGDAFVRKIPAETPHQRLVRKPPRRQGNQFVPLESQ